MSGERNCPIYNAAESNGITVEAASFPAFIEAMVLRYGTPMPLAMPMKAEPASSSGSEDPSDSSRYPAMNHTGGKYFIPWRNPRIIFPKTRPMKKATTSSPTIIRVMALLESSVPAWALMAKRVG